MNDSPSCSKGNDVHDSSIYNWLRKIGALLKHDQKISIQTSLQLFDNYLQL